MCRFAVGNPANAPGVIAVAATQDNLIASPVFVAGTGNLQVLSSRFPFEA